MKTIKEITIIDYDAGNLFNIVSTLKKLNRHHYKNCYTI